MAALLPHDKLEYKDGEVLVDNYITSGIANKEEKVLIGKHADSVAIDYKDLMGYVSERDGKMYSWEKGRIYLP